MVEALALHWPEYLIEGALLGMFMLAACSAVVVMEHPSSPVHRRIASGRTRRAIIGVLMGLTAIALITSPLGRRSGAHMNPSVTLAFLALRKIAPIDAAFYVAGQVLGGLAGVLAARMLWGQRVAHERVRYAATRPGARGVWVAFAAEFLIAFVLLSVVLLSANDARTMAYTPYAAGMLVAIFITLEAPLSGMSMNPARTLASAVFAREFRSLWVYFIAPPLAMLCAGGAYAALTGGEHVFCAKLDHTGPERCIFRCGIDRVPGRVAGPENTP